MKRYFLWLKTEYKRAMLSLPFMLTEAIVLAAVIGTIAFCCTKLLYNRETERPFTAAVVVPGQNVLTEMALQFVEQMDSVSKLCSFVTTDAETGRKMLREGSVAMVIELPEQVIEDILSGENTPITIYTGEDMSELIPVFRQLTDAGVRVLAVAQAEIYSMYDIMSVSEREQAKHVHGERRMANMNEVHDIMSVSEREQAKDTVNQWNMQLFAGRQRIFDNQVLTATGKLSVVEYYGAVALVWYLMMSGLAFHGYLAGWEDRRNRQLTLLGITEGMQVGGRILVQSVLTGISLLLPLAGVMYLYRQGIVNLNLSAGKLAGILLCVVCSAAFGVLVYELAGKGNGGMVLLGISAFILQVVSGGFIPFVLLPDAVQKVASWTPVYYMMNIMRQIFTAGRRIPIADMSIIAAFIVLFYGIAMLYRKYRQR